MAWDYYFGSSKQFFINLETPMLQLQKGHEKSQVYAVGLDGVKHYIYNEAQLREGAKAGLWEGEDKLHIIAQEKLDAMPEGFPIMLGL